MPEALALVKRRLGADAVIVHTRQFKRGGVLGMGAKTVVEVTAAAGADWPARPSRRARSPQPARSARPIGRATDNRSSQSGSHAAMAVAGGGANDSSGSDMNAMPSAGDLIRQTYAAARAEIASASAGDGLGASVMAGGAAVMAPPRTGVGAMDQTAIAQEMRAVKRMVSRMMDQQRRAAAPALPDKLFDQYINLIEQEVAEELADEIVREVSEELDETAIHDESLVREAILRRLASLIRVDDQAGQFTKPEDGRPRTIALIGPTGVGKTTTVAKLAANFKLKQHKKVGLITSDTYRIAAVEQLRTYAGILGVPLHVANSPERMIEAMRACRDCDVVLIDTAGRSQRDDPKLDQLRTFIRAADPHEVHLVLSLTSHQSVLLEAVERFSAIRTDRMIFTKLDEAVNFGVLVNVAKQVDTHLSFVATGQEVPHDLEATRPDRLARLVMGEGI